MRILHLLPSLRHNSAATQVLMQAELLGPQDDLHVAVLDNAVPSTTKRLQADISTHELGGRRALDLLLPWRLRGLLRAIQPHRIHVWRLPALRALAFAGRKWLNRCVVSQVLPHRAIIFGVLDRWLLRRTGWVIGEDEVEVELLRARGIGINHIAQIRRGVKITRAAPPTGASARRVVCLGNIEPGKGFRVALRAADFLAYCFEDLDLEIAGQGPHLESLQRSYQGVYHNERIHLVGPCDDVPSWLAGAAVCWVPSLTATGRQVALEAMAAGVPVVAGDLPHFRDIIRDGVTGLLAPPGDAPALARQTRLLFLDERLRQRIAQAGQEHVRTHFSASTFARTCRDLYDLEAGRCAHLRKVTWFTLAGEAGAQHNAQSGCREAVPT
jgi:glycosyltransferase involved in cell wall biosynthesis